VRMRRGVDGVESLRMLDVRCGVCCYTRVRWEEARGRARVACLLPFPLVLDDVPSSPSPDSRMRMHTP
jgi:hypothetical protein